MSLKRRLDALDDRRAFVTIGELLDHLDGAPLPAGRRIDPALTDALAALPRGRSVLAGAGL